MQYVARYVAALTSLRIVSPLWTILRPVTGGAVTSKVGETVQQLKDILLWGIYSPELEDYTLRFRHPALAEEFLRQQEVATNLENLVGVLNPVLAASSPGKRGDLWVV